MVVPSNIRMVSARQMPRRPLPSLKSGDRENIIRDESLDSSEVQSVQENRQIADEASRVTSYDAMSPNQERIIQETEDGSVSIRELPSLNTSQIEEFVAPLGDVLEKNPPNWDDETIAKFCESLRQRTKEKKAPNPDVGTNMVYIERKGYFAKKNKFHINSQKAHATGIEGILSKLDGNLLSKYRDVATAFIVQKAYHNIALIIQGFLSGLSLGQAVFAIHFATEELLLEGYRSMSLPVHVVFVVSFTIACVAAFDRLGFYGLTWEGIGKTVGHHGFLGVVLWSTALISSLMCIRFDELLSGKQKVVIPPGEFLFWRICCGVRAVASAAAWLLLALRPESDVLGETIQQCVTAQADVQKSLASGQVEQEEVKNILTTLQQQIVEHHSPAPNANPQ